MHFRYFCHQFNEINKSQMIVDFFFLFQFYSIRFAHFNSSVYNIRCIVHCLFVVLIIFQEKYSCSAQKRELQYHPKCTKESLRIKNSPDWHCSKQCLLHSIYCCKVNLNHFFQSDAVNWAGCALGDNCTKSPGGWYHTNCIAGHHNNWQVNLLFCQTSFS